MTRCFDTQAIPDRARQALDGEGQIFAFEQDFAGSLRCIPMIVRFKLDLAGVKLSLRQWSQLDRPTRGWLVGAPCGTPNEIAEYRVGLVSQIEAQADEPPKLLSTDGDTAWADVTRTAASVQAWSEKIGVAVPTDAQWRGLSDLQRFTLIKLTRAGHDNDNFYPAMVEFGLAESAIA